MRIADYAALSPETVVAAVESTGRACDLRVFALNSYENRVYQVGIEDEAPVIAKFYRPNRWTDEQIREEHTFCLELADAELPVVAPVADDSGQTLHTHAGYRFALFPRKGGQAPEPGDLDQLHRIGTLLGRIHAVAASRPFVHRPALDLERFLDRPSARVLGCGLLPGSLSARYEAVTRDLRDAIRDTPGFDGPAIRTQGDCHPGNIVWTRDEGPWFVDFDDCQHAPAVQDLWMLLAGERRDQEAALLELLDGYTAFHDFDPRELRLVEPLRTLRLLHYAGWLAERWEDPAFPRAFPWFGTERYWQSHVAELEEQRARLHEPPLRAL